MTPTYLHNVTESLKTCWWKFITTITNLPVWFPAIIHPEIKAISHQLHGDVRQSNLMRCDFVFMSRKCRRIAKCKSDGGTLHSQDEVMLIQKAGASLDAGATVSWFQANPPTDNLSHKMTKMYNKLTKHHYKVNIIMVIVRPYAKKELLFAILTQYIIDSLFFISFIPITAPTVESIDPRTLICMLF